MRLPSHRRGFRTLTLERLEERAVPAAPAIPVGPSAVVTVGLTPQQVGQADAVIDWNATMLQAIRTAATPPPQATRVMAMVGVAVADAALGIHPDASFYPVPGLHGSPPAYTSAAAAAIAAADSVLTALFPTQQALFDAEAQATLARIPDNVRKTAGLAWGQTVASAVLAWRSQDGASATSTYQAAPSGGPAGQYELTPSGYQPALAPQWGQVTPWAMTSADQFLPPPPPALDSAAYAAAFNEVKSLGGTQSTTRTADETLYAHFWADLPGHSATPPGHWDEIAEHVALQQHLTLAQNARLFALLNISLADAAINCWEAKYVYNLWRPVTAIRDPRAAQLNPATSSDPTWTPLWNTPNFPSYTSGHATFSGAASTILTAFFGPSYSFNIGSDDMPGYSRSFTSFAQAADEAADSRLMGGIHFRFDNEAGLTCGRQVGAYVLARTLSGWIAPPPASTSATLSVSPHCQTPSASLPSSNPPLATDAPSSATKPTPHSFLSRTLVALHADSLWSPLPWAEG